MRTIKVRITPDELRGIKAATMACWWPSRITGVTVPAWAGIAGELEGLIEGAEARFAYGTADLAELHQLRSYWQLARDKAREQCPKVTQITVGACEGIPEHVITLTERPIGPTPRAIQTYS